MVIKSFGKSKHQLISIALLVFAATFTLTLIAPSVKELVVDTYGVDEAVGSLFISLEVLAYVIFAVIWGAVSDYAGRRRPFIVFGFAGSALLYLCMASAGSLPLLFVLRFAQGAVTVAAWSLLMSLAMDLAPRERYGRAMGVLGAALGVGMAAGAPIGGLIADEWGHSAPLLAAAALFAVSAVASLGLREVAGEKRRPDSVVSALRTLFRRKALAIPYAYAFVDRFTMGFFVYVFPLYVATALDASAGMRGMYLAMFLIPFALLQYPAGRLSDRIGRVIPLVGGSVAYGVAVMAVGFAPMTASGEMLTTICMVAAGVTAAFMYPPSMSLVGDISVKGERGVAMGGFNLFGSLGFVVGPAIGGMVVVAAGYPQAFLVAGAAELAVALVTLYFLLRLFGRGRGKH